MTSCVHKMCRLTYGQTNMKRAITLTKINHPWNRYNMCMLRSWPIKIPNMNKMRILCRFHGWLIFARVIALFMFVWPYVCPHNLCTQLVICLLSHFIHIGYLGWNDLSCVHKMCEWTYGQINMKWAITLAKINHPWNRYNMYSPFHVCLTIRLSAHLVYATSHLSFVAFYSFTYTRLRDGRTDGRTDKGFSSIPTTLRVGV
jgi:hypothetical protein